MTRAIQRWAGRRLLTRMLEAPDFAGAVRALPAAAFVGALREIGVEDAAELVAVASREQLVAAFDEALFTNDAPGEREHFDVDRFVTWLEVLLEAGDDVAAQRLSELSEDFVLHALTALVRVLDHDALRDAVNDADTDSAEAIEKALEGALCQEIDGYFLVSRDARGWDAALAVILALDRDHRALLERLLDRAARLSSRLVEDLEALTATLNDVESLAEDVEAEREDRRAALGHVEPRAARAFLSLAKACSDPDVIDPITRAYFRALPSTPSAGHGEASAEGAAALLRLPPRDAVVRPPIFSALLLLRDLDPAAFSARLDELAYLANVLLAGATGAEGERLEPTTAAEAALATVTHGAALLGATTTEALCALLRETRCDARFRRASTALHEAGRRPAFVMTLARDAAPTRHAATARLRRPKARGRSSA